MQIPPSKTAFWHAQCHVVRWYDSAANRTGCPRDIGAARETPPPPPKACPSGSRTKSSDCETCIPASPMPSNMILDDDDDDDDNGLMRRTRGTAPTPREEKMGRVSRLGLCAGEPPFRQWFLRSLSLSPLFLVSMNDLREHACAGRPAPVSVAGSPSLPPSGKPAKRDSDAKAQTRDAEGHRRLVASSLRVSGDQGFQHSVHPGSLGKK
ncbi:uncharacterized protein LY79DRAFT_258294 [Colletotrichum navitas]|uniref:Uncharacterized protein n=1 Tax=Colletotrichum navitas TaxID=681940 RepID=A0AAD8PXI2_9PEZI|nr:uncharacterized protein LY79DRAFT_258294 [Colletotrichum navitas]KAK1585884.1 hypothetical protein LY79DRAFT_258294 [Colletotrichum navitas]